LGKDMMKSSEHAVGILDYYDVESAYANEFRRLLHNINEANSGQQKKSILITSALLSEGKSTVAAFLAVTAARLKHKKVLLVDCDLRRPTLHKLFAVSRENGIAEILGEGKTAKEMIKKTWENSLDLLTAGKVSSHPTELLDSAAIHKFLEEVRFYYDLIIVDCAPVLPVSDPMLLAAEMDGIVMVIKAGNTQREVVKRALMLMENNHPQFLGVVLNNLDNILPFYYKDSYYGYEYKPKSVE